VVENPKVMSDAVSKGYIKPSKPNQYGNVGAALARITLWEHLSQNDPDAITLIMEDNALFTEESLRGTCASIRAAGVFDFLNLSVLRPRGTLINAELGLRRVGKHPVVEMLPNVWLSSYLVTGHGASKILECFKRKPVDMGSHVIDRVLVQDCLHGDPKIDAFIVDHHRFFGHIETGGDGRKFYNR